MANNEHFVRARLENCREVDSAVAGCDAIVHLGGIAKEASWDKLISNNLLGTINIFEAARRHGVSRVVLASSMHTMGFFGLEECFTENTPPRPDSRYAVSKLWVEAVGKLFAQKYGIAVTCIRIGHATHQIEQAEPGNWIGATDLASLIRLGLERTEPGFVLMHGVTSYCGLQITDDRLQREFGFTFTAGGSAYDEVLKRMSVTYPDDPAAQRWRGGIFASGDGNMV